MGQSPTTRAIMAPMVGILRNGLRESALIGVLAVAAAGMAAYPASDPDAFFHLAMGRRILETGQVAQTEVHCIVSEGRPFWNHEWGFDALSWVAYDRLGPPGITAFKAVLAAILFSMVAVLGVRLGGRLERVVALAILFLPLFRGHLDLRPHLAGYALAAAHLMLLLELEAGKRVAWAGVVAITALWANLHGSFPLAIVLWGLIAGTSAIEHRPPAARRLLWSAGPAIAVATLLNPWGIGLWAVVFHHLEPAYRRLVPEWMPPSYAESPIQDALLLGLMAASLMSFLRARNRRQFRRLGLMLLFLIPAATSSKFILGLAVGAVPVLAANLEAPDAPGRRSRWLLWGSAILSVVAFPRFLSPFMGPGVGLASSDQPAAAIRFAKAHGLSGRVFLPFHEGGFVEFEAWPDLRPFLDGRAYLHGLDGIRRYLAALEDYEAFRALHREVRFDLVIVDFLDPSFPRLTAGLTEDPEFDLVFLDSRHAVFLPDRNRPRNLPKFRFLRATSDPRYLERVAADDFAAVSDEVSRVLANPEGETLGLLLRGVFGLVRARAGLDPDSARSRPGDPAACGAAVADLQRLVASRPDVPMFRYFLARALACTGACVEALAAVRGSDFPDAKRLLRVLESGGCKPSEL